MSPAIAPADTAAVSRMWEQYAAAHPHRIMPGEEAIAECFGDSAELCDELLGLVLHGPKRATAALVAEFAAEGQALPRIGGHWVAYDSTGAPRAILRTIELRIGVIESVDDRFSWDEGEDDRTRDSWLENHRRYWRRAAAAAGVEFSETSEVVFERFQVVWPAKLADAWAGAARFP